MNSKYTQLGLDIDLAKNVLINQISNDIGFNITYREIRKYANSSDPITTQLHDTAIGLLFDEKWDVKLGYIVLDELSTLVENSPWGCLSEKIGYKDYSLNNSLISHNILQKINYGQFLKSTYWRLVKDLKELSHFSCQLCGVFFDDNKTVVSHLHHNNYSCHGYEHLRASRNSFLTLLCADCHKIFHSNKHSHQGWK